MRVISKAGRVICEIEKEIGEMTCEDIENAGWKFDDTLGVITKAIVNRVESPQGKVYEYTDHININYEDVFAEARMHYSEYKRDYSEYKTAKGSYDAETKMVTVLIPLIG